MVIRSISHQKHITRVDKGQCTKCTTTNFAHVPATTISATCLHIKTRIITILLQTSFLWKRNGIEISSSQDKYQIRKKINGEESKLQARQVNVTAKFSTSLKSSINRDEDLENNNKKKTTSSKRPILCAKLRKQTSTTQRILPIVFILEFLSVQKNRVCSVRIVL